MLSLEFFQNLLVKLLPVKAEKFLSNGFASLPESKIKKIESERSLFMIQIAITENLLFNLLLNKVIRQEEIHSFHPLGKLAFPAEFEKDADGQSIIADWLHSLGRLMEKGKTIVEDEDKLSFLSPGSCSMIVINLVVMGRRCLDIMHNLRYVDTWESRLLLDQMMKKIDYNLPNLLEMYFDETEELPKEKTNSNDFAKLENFMNSASE